MKDEQLIAMFAVECICDLFFNYLLDSTGI